MIMNLSKWFSLHHDHDKDTWLLSSAENGDWSPQQHVRTPLRMVTMVIADHGEYMISMNSMNPWVVPKYSVHHTPINHSKDWDTEFCFVSEAQIVQTPIGQIVILLPAATDDDDDDDVGGDDDGDIDDDGDEASTWITIWSNENLQKLRLDHPRNSSPIVILEFQSLGL